MFSSSFRLIIVLGVAIHLAACTVPGPVSEVAVAEPAAAPAAEKPVERPIPQDSIYPLLVAEFALRRQSFDVALEHYLSQSEALRDPAVSAHTTHLAQFMEREPEALEAVLLWVELEPDSLEANNTLATLLVRQGRTLEALPHVAQIARGGGNARFPILLNGFAELSPSDQAALSEGIDKLAIELPNDSQLILAQALIFEQRGQREDALQRLQRIFELEPFHYQGLLLEAKLQLELKRENPLQHMEQALQSDPDNSRLRLQYARLLTRSDMAAAKEQFEILARNSPEDADLLFSLALINREIGDDQAAKQRLEQLVALDKRSDDAHYYLGRIAEDERELKTAVAQYMKVEAGRDFLGANHRIGRIMLASGQAGKLHDYLNQLRDQYPQRREQLYALEADLLSSMGEIDAAMAVLNQALAEMPEATSLQYTRSMLGEQQDNLALMESDLRAIIAREPNNTTALNALGYSLANRTERYEEALALISQALELAPEEPAILDSMGWILYRMGSNQEALGYLSRAYAKFPDPEVAAHLGEVLWINGDTEQAMQIWRGALLQAPEHHVLTATLKRLGVEVPKPLD